MEQFLDADNKWHVTLTVDIPRVIVKNKLNFRLHSIVMKDGSIVRDPSLASSNYIFGISTSFLGKKTFFFSFFDATQIEDVAEFKFGLCDEGVRWYGNTIFSVNNKYIKPEIIENEKSTQLFQLKEEVELVKEPEFDIENISGPSNIDEAVFNAGVVFELPPEVINKESATVMPQFTNPDNNKKTYPKKLGRKKK